jgi:hypothetical protein
MIEAARRARRPDRQSRDARFARAMRASACNLRRSELVRSGHLGFGYGDARNRAGSGSAGLARGVIAAAEEDDPQLATSVGCGGCVPIRAPDSSTVE